MKRVAAAVALATVIAVPAEGLRHYAYFDPPGVLTVCFGSTTNVVRNRYYTLDECKKRLSDEMLEAVEAVDRCVPGLPEHVLAAFGDAVYNIGPKIACDRKSSTAARLLAAGRIDDACRQLPRWSFAKVAGVPVKLPGLVKRRDAEMRLCLQGVEP